MPIDDDCSETRTSRIQLNYLQNKKIHIISVHFHHFDRITVATKRARLYLLFRGANKETVYNERAAATVLPRDEMTFVVLTNGSLFVRVSCNLYDIHTTCTHTLVRLRNPPPSPSTRIHHRLVRVDNFVCT